MAKKLFKKYVILRELRTVGGYMRVFLAKQAGLDRSVELRLLNRPRDHDGKTFARFKRECKTLAKLDHPSIARVLDTGYTETRLFYTTEYRNAVSLEDLLQQVGEPFKRQEVLEVAAAVGSALVHLHANQILHRNISTRSVFFDVDNDRPYISEFAMAKDLEASSFPAGTNFSTVVSTPTPELIEGIPYDHLTDLFLCGAMLYRLATFTDPFPAIQEANQLNPDVLFDIMPPSGHNSYLPQRFDKLIMRLLQPKREDRFQSAQELCDALGQKSRLMDAQSLIQRERKELLQGIRTTMRLKRPDDLSAPALGTADAEDAEQGEDGAPEQTEKARRKSLLGKSAIIAEGRALVAAMRGSSDSSSIILAIVGMIAAVAMIGLAYFSGTLMDSPGRVRPPDGRERLVAKQHNSGDLEERVLKIAGNFTYSKVTEHNFLDRWKLIKAYSLALPQKIRRKVVPYSKLLSIKLKFYSDPVGAAADLEEAFLSCDKFIKSPSKE